MKVVFCIGSMGKGGAERVVANLSNDLVKKYNVSIIVTTNSKSSYELDSSINYYTLDKDGVSSNVIIRTIKRIKALRFILKSEKPDIVLSFLPEPTFRLMIAKAFLKTKVIISVRNDPNIEYHSLIKKFLVNLLYTNANGFVFQTIDAKKWFNKKIQNKSVVIPNPINPKFICEPYAGIREKSIVTVGRLTEQKNHRLLIESFSDVLKVHSDYILKIYGAGELKSDINNLIKKLNLIDKVFLMGNVDNIKDEIYKSGMFILSSNYEGMPNALMEAMALGLPCISTDCPIGGPKFLIKNKKNGILVNVNDKNDMINAINYLIENEKVAKIIGNNASNISQTLKPQNIIKKWHDYILHVLKE